MRSSSLRGVIGFLALAIVVSTASQADAWGFWFRGTAGLNLVHGIDGPHGVPVDIVVSNNFRTLRLNDVTFGTAASLEELAPGFIRPGWVWVGIYDGDAFGNGERDRPILSRLLYLPRGANKTVAAYVASDAAGNALMPVIRVLPTDLSPLHGMARFQGTQLTVAPVLGICLDGSDISDGGIANGEVISTDETPDTYSITVSEPGDCGSVLGSPLPLDLEADVNTLVFGVGTFPASFTAVTIPVPVED